MRKCVEHLQEGYIDLRKDNLLLMTIAWDECLAKLITDSPSNFNMNFSAA